MAPLREPTLFDDLTDDEFWTRAEDDIAEALELYARQAENGKPFQRRLFAADMAQGFAFVHVCRQRFDVVLMNPPFGEASRPSKALIDKCFPRTKNDVYAAFVERGLQLLRSGGMLGAITSRTGFFLSSFQRWREEILLQEAQPTVFADLGYGVLDTAMVETAAYCLAKARTAI
jgi:Eco57I restriction-modification methylase